VDEEFETLDLGDPRRDRRAKAMAAYRFLGNERIDWRDMMQPHWDGQRELHRCPTRIWDGPRSAIRSIRLKASDFLY
jgi:hypothetical protein